jgi:hypothetical protein
MPKTLRDKYAKNEEKHRKKLVAEMELEKDMVYKLRFICKVSNPDNLKDEIIPLYGNPNDYPDAVEDAIKRYQSNHNVFDWRDIAEKYEIIKIWNP